MPQTEYAIQLEHVTKTFGPVIANHDVTMNIRRGEILSLLGENGSGKTTLMNMIAGIYYPDGGQIIVNGRPVDIRSPRDALALGKDIDCPAILKIEVVPYALASCALNRSRQLSAGKTGRFHRENLYQAVDSLTVNTAVFVWIEKMYCIHPAVLLLRLARVQSGFPPTSGVLFRVLVSWR